MQSTICARCERHPALSCPCTDLCAACAEQAAAYDRAFAALDRQILPVLDAWLDAWAGQEFVGDMAEHLGQLAAGRLSRGPELAGKASWPAPLYDGGSGPLRRG